MNQDLKIIKKKYGEAMMHLCRCLFSTILDNHPGVLPQILLENFNPSHYLYDDIMSEKQGEKVYLVKFKNYIYSLYDNLRITETKKQKNTINPIMLMKQAGYTLFECKSEKDIQAFRKYYAKGEALCTFNGGRLGRCYVFFAVKDNVDEIKRDNFPIPDRQDEYGTSVISIQFTRDPSHTLSIKNRYNHTVLNPDATYSNNLDNIIPGLTDSFNEHYGLTQTYQPVIDFELPNYVRANDGKLYKYNYEVDNIYYCPDNIVIDNFQVRKYDKEKYLIIDYFIIDLVNKIITTSADDSFPHTIPGIKKISIINESTNKIITISLFEGEDIIIIINKYYQITSLQNNNIVNVPDNFLRKAYYIEKIILGKAITINNNFLQLSCCCDEVTLPNVKIVADNFMEFCNIEELSLPNALEIGARFMALNSKKLETINLPRVKIVGRDFLTANKSLKFISLPRAMIIKDGFLHCNEELQEVNLPRVKIIGTCFCYLNKNIIKIELPEVKAIDSGFLQQNTDIKELILPKLESIDFFINSNKNIETFYAPLITTGTDKSQKVIHQKRLIKIKI